MSCGLISGVSASNLSNPVLAVLAITLPSWPSVNFGDFGKVQRPHGRAVKTIFWQRLRRLTDGWTRKSTIEPILAPFTADNKSLAPNPIDNSWVVAASCDLPVGRRHYVRRDACGFGSIAFEKL